MACMAQRASRLGLVRRARQMARIWSSTPEADPVVTVRQHSGTRVRGSRLRLALTSAHPGVAQGAVRISKLEAPAG